MTVNHVFYIPLILLLGLFVGSFLGKKAAYRDLAEREREAREREARREERAQRRAGGGKG